LFQSHSLDKERERALLVAARNGESPAPTISDVEKRALTAARKTGGRITIALAQQAAGISERQAEKLLTEWRSRGWARKDARQANAHVLTEAAPEQMMNAERRTMNDE